jgi:hypothetical protein
LKLTIHHISAKKTKQKKPNKNGKKTRCFQLGCENLTITDDEQVYHQMVNAHMASGQVH